MKRSVSSLGLLRAGRKVAVLALVGSAVLAAPAMAYSRAAGNPPALVITNDPLPAGLQNKIYNKPTQAPVINPQDVMSPAYYDDKGETPVGRKVDTMRNELFDLQGRVAKLAENLASIENNGQNQAAAYYASVATISTQLQSGTTPGNPRLLQKFQVARDTLEQFGANIQTLNDLALQINSAASNASYLLETVRATYSLTGAVEEDHVRLAQMEDSINNTNVVIERLLNNVNDDITRTTAYLNTERDNMRTMALAIESGSLFGKSLSNRPFSNAQLASFSPSASSGFGGGMEPANANMGVAAHPGLNGPRPLVKIRFDRPDVDYQQPLYMAVSEALKRYPDARFELVAVHPTKGNAAQVAIESTKARRDAEKVLRSLTEMGLTLDRIDLSYTPSADASTSEVHLYIR
jgi:hypothetical protein